VRFMGGRPSGAPVDVLTGFVRDNGEAMGRPVGVAIDKGGALLVADDVGNTVWRITGTPAGNSGVPSDQAVTWSMTVPETQRICAIIFIPAYRVR